MFILVKLSTHAYNYIYFRPLKKSEQLDEIKNKIQDKVDWDANDDAEISIKAYSDLKVNDFVDLIKLKKVKSIDRRVSLDQLCDLSWDC